jgi:t-SNARE complex subunit (syntaxin)
MAQVFFDTLKFVKTLETAGLPAAQAEAISSAVKDSHEAVDVATKRDLEDVRKDIESRFAKTDSEIANVRKDM